MTLEQWLATREPAPPPALAERLRALLGAEALGSDIADAPEMLATAAERALGRLLGDGCETRAAALDLLAADALVTLALLGQAQLAPERLDALAVSLLGGTRPDA